MARFPRRIALALIATLLAAPSISSELRVVAPERPLALSCFHHKSESLSAAIILEEIEGDVVDGHGYGNVTTAEGESWGFLSAYSGDLNGAFLTVTEIVQVEGHNQEITRQWVFVDNGLVSDMGYFDKAKCGPIEQEYLDRVTN